MTEWITEEDWSTVKVGDQVRVTRETATLMGAVEALLSTPEGVYGLMLDTGMFYQKLPVILQEWSLFVPAKPPVELPTEVGFYLDKNGALATLNNGGIWRDSYEDFIQTLDIRAYAPFTKLEPVAVTAKKVLDRVRAQIIASDQGNHDGIGTRDSFRSMVQVLSVEFGVEVDE